VNITSTLSISCGGEHMNTSSGDTSLAIPVAKRKQSYFHKYGKTKNSTLLGYLRVVCFLDLRDIITDKQLVGITPYINTSTKVVLTNIATT
jgi:hypothetical protein